MRGDDQLIAVLDFQKRILRVHGLFAKHIQTCCPNGTFCKSGIQICLIDNCTSCQVQKNGSLLHLAEIFQGHQILCISIQWCMYRHNIRPGKKLVQAYLLIGGIVFASGCGIAQNMASEGFRNLRHLPADGSKANDSPCFSI